MANTMRLKKALIYREMAFEELLYPQFGCRRCFEAHDKDECSISS